MNLIRSEQEKRERGSVLVEAGLIFIVGTVLMFGTFDIAQMLFIHQVVVNQVRTAARWAAVNTYDSGKITNMVLYGTPTAGATGSGLFGMTASNVNVAHDTSDGLYADRIVIIVSGYSYLLFSGAIANATQSGSPSVSRTGLTAGITVPHEHID